MHCTFCMRHSPTLLSIPHYQRRSHGGYAFAAAREAEPLGCGGLDRHTPGMYMQVISYVLNHEWNVRQHFRSLSHDGNIHITHRISFRLDNFTDFTQQHPRISPFISWIRVRKMIAYVTHGSGPQQRITQRMQGHISVTVPEQSERIRYLDSTNPQITSFDQPMDIKTITYANIHNANLTFTKNLAQSVHVKRQGETERLVQR